MPEISSHWPDIVKSIRTQPLADAGNEITKEPLDYVSADVDALPFKLSDKLAFVKPMLRLRMFQETSIKPATKRMAGYP